MWGVNHSINDLSQVPVPVMLLPDDFKASTKIKVINHFFNKENLPGQFKFKEYCPQVFRNLRERFGIEDQDYQVSLARSALLKEDEGKFEGPLLTSYDHTLVVKEISSEEVEEMHTILSEEVYFMGLIDVLTQYDTKRRAAHAARAVKHGAGAEISTLHPEQYAKCFSEVINKIFA
uniref:Phosphatidylinositol 5-phosphate 4-kinase type-2 gamma n=1 Tax=Nothobranchius rachovii TaxID=451742 RepID=A0A1A8P6H1_9TELE